MPNREIHNSLHFVPLFPPVAADTGNTPIVSSIIDLANYNAAELVMVFGNDADTDFTTTILVEDGNDPALADNATVAASQLVGTIANAADNFTQVNVARKIGYIGSKRYVRVTITPASNTGNLFVGGVAVLGYAATAPTPNQA